MKAKDTNHIYKGEFLEWNRGVVLLLQVIVLVKSGLRGALFKGSSQFGGFFRINE